MNVKYKVMFPLGGHLTDENPYPPSHIKHGLERVDDIVANNANKEFRESAGNSTQVCAVVGGKYSANSVSYDVLIQGTSAIPDDEFSKDGMKRVEEKIASVSGYLGVKRCSLHEMAEDGKVQAKEIVTYYYGEDDYGASPGQYNGEYRALMRSQESSAHIEFAEPSGLSDFELLSYSDRARLCQEIKKIYDVVKNRDEEDFSKATNGVLYYDDNHKLVFDAWQVDGQTPEQFRENMKSLSKALGKDVASFSLDGVEQSVEKEISDVKREKRSCQLDAKFGGMLEADSNRYTLDNEMGN